jgi:hypothetical protein
MKDQKSHKTQKATNKEGSGVTAFPQHKAATLL